MSLPYRAATYGELGGIAGGLRELRLTQRLYDGPYHGGGVESLGGPVAHVVEAICQPGIDRYPVL